jgi:hypothetical protein
MLASAPARKRAAGRAVERALREDGHLLPGRHRAARLETFLDSYGLDGTILGLPGDRVHLEIVRARQASYPGGGLDQLVFYLPDVAAREQMQARLAATGARPILEEDLACQPGVSARQCYLLGVMLWLSYPGLAPPGDGGSRTASVSHRERGG